MSEVTISDSLREDLYRLSMGCRILAMEGHDDMSLGHLSLRDPEGRGLWLKRRYLGLDEIRGPDDFILLGLDGRKLSGQGGSHREWPIHTEIMKARPDIQVIGHTHPFYASLFTATEETLQPIGLEGMHFGMNTPHYRDTSNLIDSVKLGQDLAQSLGDAHVVFMRNHGVTYVGDTIDLTVIRGLWVEKACKAQITLSGSGLSWGVPDPEDWKGKSQTVGGVGFWENFFMYYCRKLMRREGAVAEAERVRTETFGWKSGDHFRW